MKKPKLKSISVAIENLSTSEITKENFCPINIKDYLANKMSGSMTRFYEDHQYLNDEQRSLLCE